MVGYDTEATVQKMKIHFEKRNYDQKNKVIYYFEEQYKYIYII